MIGSIALVLAAAFFDRTRGGFPDDRRFPAGKPAWISAGRHLAKFLYGMALAALVTTDWRLILAAGVTWKFGEQLAGDFSGTFRLVSNQPYPWGPLVKVGFLWPALSLPLAYFDPHLLLFLPASVYGCLMGPILARALPLPLTHWLDLIDYGAWQELLRGGAIAAFLAIFMAFGL
ncbi:MAG: hypothetical protein AB7Q01_14120 [Gammaproteobacteria bacterium]